MKQTDFHLKTDPHCLKYQQQPIFLNLNPIHTHKTCLSGRNMSNMAHHVPEIGTLCEELVSISPRAVNFLQIPKYRICGCIYPPMPLFAFWHILGKAHLHLHSFLGDRIAEIPDFQLIFLRQGTIESL
ncbi:hypothetical protein M9H77_31875 [Catharanthus roseus]|uniref:Uncharacterized protein n=1 Tax=Catharanthus roseus TaxID=4058 RepID=A0ACC0A1D8_CATRO|nr:hypothetical protein M9H77_31875 [Catharanthus roseus]